MRPTVEPSGNLSRFVLSPFREVRGCRDAYLTPGHHLNFTRPEYAMLTREDARRAPAKPQLSAYKDANVPTVYGSRYVYLINRKAASRTLQDVDAALHAAGVRGPDVERVLAYTFAREPLARLWSGYEEVVDRHVDRAWCGHRGADDHGADYLCRHAFVARPPETRERFEGFLNATLLGPIDRLEDDAMSYHVLSQSRQFVKFRNVAFVGKIETLRDDVLRLLGVGGVRDPEKWASTLPRLARLLGADARNWSDASTAHPIRAAHARMAARLRRDRLADLGAAAGPRSYGTDRAAFYARAGLARRREPFAPDPKNQAAFLAALTPFARALVVDYYRQDAACLGYDWPDA